MNLKEVIESLEMVNMWPNINYYMNVFLLSVCASTKYIFRLLLEIKKGFHDHYWYFMMIRSMNQKYMPICTYKYMQLTTEPQNT